ncbi:MAG: DUF4271 domain-containing protein [Bacteroidales bacterium]|nr:DUF4271 domain-containing protein [Bacteroidales bacterium]
MIQQPDSIQHNVQQTATEEPQPQQNEEAQAMLQVGEDSVTHAIYETSTSHWPVKVDSVLRPDQGKELKAEVKPLPKYYKDSFFARDSLLHSELQGGRYGIAGDPVPYTVRADNVLTPTLLFSILMLMLCVRRSSRFLLFQFRNFFHIVRSDSALERESTVEKRYLVFAEAYVAVVLTLVFYFFTKTYIAETYVTYSEYTLLGIYFGGIISLFVFEYLLQTAVNNVFFTTHECKQWTTARMVLIACTGIALTPMLLLLTYFGMSIENALVYTAIVIVLEKILLFYKCFLIFFKKISLFLQFFLYFCTLEVIPPLLAWGILVEVANHLKVSY